MLPSGNANSASSIKDQRCRDRLVQTLAGGGVGGGEGGVDTDAAAAGGAAAATALRLVGQLDVAEDGDHVSAEALVVVVEFGTATAEVRGVLKDQGG